LGLQIVPLLPWRYTSFPTVKYQLNVRARVVLTSCERDRDFMPVRGSPVEKHNRCLFFPTLRSRTTNPDSFAASFGLKRYNTSCMGLTLGAGREWPSDSKCAITSSITPHRSAYRNARSEFANGTLCGHWFARQSAADEATARDPLWLNRKKLKFQFGGEKHNDKMRGLVPEPIGARIEAKGPSRYVWCQHRTANRRES
jgi:hypothetical protein